MSRARLREIIGRFTIAFIANAKSGNKEKTKFHKAVIRGLGFNPGESTPGHSEEGAFVRPNHFKLALTSGHEADTFSRLRFG